MTKNCLNCEKKVEGNFCKNCGQKTSTHRFSLTHFFLHDFIHGIFHVDEGIFFTLKKLFTNPGNSIRNYVQGKRVGFFNSFTLIVLLITTNHLIRLFFHVDLSVLHEDKDRVIGYLRVAENFDKFIKLFGVPFYAIFSYLLFIKTKQNYTENLVLNMYATVGILTINVLFSLFLVIINNIFWLNIFRNIFIIISISYFFWFYYQYFSVFEYKKFSLLMRCFLMTIFTLVIKYSIDIMVSNIGLVYFL